MICPHCKKVVPSKKTGYTEDFDRFWEVYEARKRVPSASKSDAMKAWLQIEDSRPEPSALLAAVKAYHEYIDRTSTPACHPSTWLRQGRYEGFITNENPNVAPDLSRTIPHWPRDLADALLTEIGEKNFKAWFAETEFSMEGPTPVAVILVQSEFRINHIKKHFAKQLYSVVGAFRLVPM